MGKPTARDTQGNQLRMCHNLAQHRPDREALSAWQDVAALNSAPRVWHLMLWVQVVRG